jgi:hypothetical protein
MLKTYFSLIINPKESTQFILLFLLSTLYFCVFAIYIPSVKLLNVYRWLLIYEGDSVPSVLKNFWAVFNPVLILITDVSHPATMLF